MKIKIKEIEIYIDYCLLIGIIVLIFSKDIRKFLANYYLCYSFTIFHEAMHMFFASIFNEIPKKINLTVLGLNLIYNNNFKHLRKYKKLIIYFSGPISNLLLALIFDKINIVKNVNYVLCIINLLPVYPLDGYNIINELLKNNKIIYVEKGVQFLLFLISIYIFMETKNLSLLIIVVFTFVFRKIQNTT